VKDCNEQYLDPFINTLKQNSLRILRRNIVGDLEENGRALHLIRVDPFLAAGQHCHYFSHPRKLRFCKQSSRRKIHWNFFCFFSFCIERQVADIYLRKNNEDCSSSFEPYNVDIAFCRCHVKSRCTRFWMVVNFGFIPVSHGVQKLLCVSGHHLAFPISSSVDIQAWQTK